MNPTTPPRRRGETPCQFVHDSKPETGWTRKIKFREAVDIVGEMHYGAEIDLSRAELSTADLDNLAALLRHPDLPGGVTLNLSDAVIETFTPVLDACISASKSLGGLSVRNLRIKKDGKEFSIRHWHVTKIAELVKQGSQLSQLDLGGHKLKCMEGNHRKNIYKPLGSMLDEIANSQSFRLLSLDECHLGDEELDYISSKLFESGSTCQATALSLVNNTFTENGQRRFLKNAASSSENIRVFFTTGYELLPLSMLPNGRHDRQIISAQSPWMQDLGKLEIADILSKLKPHDQIDLGHQKLTRFHIEKIAAVLMSPSCPRVSLILRGATLPSLSPVLRAAAGTHRPLSGLDLGGVRIERDKMKVFQLQSAHIGQIVALLGGDGSLEKLDLVGQRLCYDGAENVMKGRKPAFADLLRAIRCSESPAGLRVLRLDACGLTHAALEAIGSELFGPKDSLPPSRLSEIEISFDDFTVRLLDNSLLTRPPTVRWGTRVGYEVNLQNCKIGADQVGAIVSILKGFNFPGGILLNLRGATVSNLGDILKAAGASGSLMGLDLCGAKQIDKCSSPLDEYKCEIENINLIASLVAENKQLCTLDMGGYELHREEATSERDWRALKQSKADAENTGKAFEKLIGSIKSAREMRELGLGDCSLTTSEIYIIQAALFDPEKSRAGSDESRLTRLDLAGNKFDTGSAMGLMMTILKPFPVPPKRNIMISKVSSKTNISSDRRWSLNYLDLTCPGVVAKNDAAIGYVKSLFENLPSLEEVKPFSKREQK